MMEYILIALTLLLGEVQGQTTKVKVSGGDVQGHIVNFGILGVVEFLGIPYAKPPVDDLRFVAPEPHDGWTGTLQADEYGPACIQDTIWIQMLSIDKDLAPKSFEEDCLSLNIFVPGQEINAEREDKLAVMVWIHGGGYQNGASSIYPGYALAAMESVIVVTLNYRLNVFGFLASGDDHIPGNMGLMDQILALKWVKGNIGAFGGDKDRVTVFGESAGALSASLLTVSPSADNLFHRVITQSGVVINRNLATREQLKEVNSIKYFAGNLTCYHGDDAARMKTCLQTARVEDIKRVRNGMVSPIVDGEGGVIPEQPTKLWNEKGYTAKDYMAGVLRDDGSVVLQIYAILNYNKYLSEGISFTEASDLVFAMLMQESAKVTEEMRMLHQIIISNYFTDLDDKGANLRALLNVYSEYSFLAPSQNAIKIMHEHGKYRNMSTYLYYFTHKSPFNPQGTVVDVGPMHADDIGYVFGYYLQLNTSTPDFLINRSIMRAWASFAKNGKPVYLDASGQEHEWLAYNSVDQHYLHIDSDLGADSMKKRLLPQRDSFWNTIVPGLMAKTSLCMDDNPSLISRDAAETALFVLCAVVFCLLLAIIIICANSRRSAPKPGKAGNQPFTE